MKENTTEKINDTNMVMGKRERNVRARLVKRNFLR